MSMILYLIGLIVLFTGTFLMRKSDEEQNAVTYLVFTAVLFMIIQAVEAGIINMIPGVNVNAPLFGCLHIIEGSALWYYILAKKRRQKYFFCLTDIAALIVLAVFVIIAAVRQFGLRLDDFNFELSDSARHYMYARDVADNGQLTSLFFSALNSGLIMNALRGLIDEFSFYRIFILFEAGILFLNGAMFWVLIRRYLKDKFSFIMGIILTVAYMLGYPWNSMVFGTAYLSTGILCVTMIMFLMDMYFNNVFHSNKGVVVLLLVSCYALLHSYSLFVPPVLGGIVLLVVFKYVKENSMPAKKLYAAGGVLLTVCLLTGIIFLYFWLVKGILDEKLDVLSWWGYIYGALYADFLFAVPFCISWFIKSIKSKTINVECTILFVFLSYTFVFFLGNYFGKISAYYYYKTYYILWIVVFMVMLKTIITLKRERSFMLSYIFTWGLLFLVYISSVEEKLPQKYNLDLINHSEGQVASDYFSLYNFNIVYGHNDTISRTVKDLYMEAARLSVQTGEFIPYIGEYAESEWTYFALAGLEHRNVLDGKNYEAAVEELKKYPYILSVECEEPIADVNKFLSTLPIAYENEAGKIYKVDSSRTDEEAINGDIDIDIILRYGLPKLERMGWVEQDAYVNSLQVIKKIENIGIDKKEFLYPELSVSNIENAISIISDEHYDKRKQIIFTGTASEELQQAINDNPNAIIDIRTKRIVLNDTIELKDGTVINGNGVKLEGYGLEYGFVGDGISNVCLNGICIEGKINYGIYLTDCSNISITDCEIEGLLQKAVCIIGTADGFNISNNKLCDNHAGGVYIAGDVSGGLIETNEITDNGGASEWMAGIVLTGVVSKDKRNIWEDFDKEHKQPQRENLYAQTDCPHEIIVRNNKVLNNNSLGVYSDGAYKCYVINNTVSGNDREGISLDYGTMGFYLEGNVFEGNGQNIGGSDEPRLPGIVMDNTAYNILRNNIIINNYGGGIKMVRSAVRNLIMENIVNQETVNTEYHLYGIEAGAEDAGNESSYMDFTPCYENVICRNGITGKYYSGIFIDEGCYVNDVFDNVIMESQAFAIEAISDMFNSIINNTTNIDIRIEGTN